MTSHLLFVVTGDLIVASGMGDVELVKALLAAGANKEQRLRVSGGCRVVLGNVTRDLRVPPRPFSVLSSGWRYSPHRGQLVWTP